MNSVIKLSVDYYNDSEKKLFQAYPNYSKIDNSITGNFNIRKDELMTYLMFTEQADEDGWRKYKDLKDRVQYRLGDVDDILDFSEGSIMTRQSSQRMNASGMTERIGVSLGLNVVNQFHGFTEADWAITDDEYINGKQVKDFDYKISMASDGKRFIQVENKGSITVDNKKKGSSISQHYASIKEKKSEIHEHESELSIPRHQNFYYGTIGVLDNKNMAKVWLVDPLAFEVDWDPRKYKLVSRLLFYYNLFQNIGIHKRILVALKERIEKIKNTEKYLEFNKVRLDNIEKTPQAFIRSNTIVRINSNEAFGTFFFIETENQSGVYIMAVTKAIIKLIINQDFEGILNYEYKNAELSENAIVELSARLRNASKDFDFSKVKFVIDERRKRYFAQRYTEVSYTSSGRIFGMILE